MSKGFKEINMHGCISGKLEIPNIGENGNWFIGNEDTGVSIQGPKGNKGDIGPQGPIGNIPTLAANLQTFLHTL